MKSKFIDAYLDVADRFSQLSTARRLKVGAIIVKENRIISIGYNGTPPGWDNDCEYQEYMDQDIGGWLDAEEIQERWPLADQLGRYCLKTRPEVIHAERNAIDKLARDGESGLDAVMFVTHGPCLECSKSIFTSGIKKVFYRDDYRDDTGLKFLTQCGVETQQVTKKKICD